MLAPYIIYRQRWGWNGKGVSISNTSTLAVSGEVNIDRRLRVWSVECECVNYIRISLVQFLLSN